METVEVVIRIPKRDFDFIKDEFADGDMPDEKDLKETTYYAIANGTVLPKGHGDLVDEKVLRKLLCEDVGCDDCTMYDAYDKTCLMGRIPTVIEADKDGQDGR